MSEEALLLAVDAAGDGAWDWNVVTGEVAMSRRYLEQLGYEPGPCSTPTTPKGGRRCQRHRNSAQRRSAANG